MDLCTFSPRLLLLCAARNCSTFDPMSTSTTDVHIEGCAHWDDVHIYPNAKVPPPLLQPKSLMRYSGECIQCPHPTRCEHPHMRCAHRITGLNIGIDVHIRPECEQPHGCAQKQCTPLCHIDGTLFCSATYMGHVFDEDYSVNNSVHIQNRMCTTIYLLSM